MEQHPPPRHFDSTRLLIIADLGVDRKDDAIALLQKAREEQPNLLVDLKVSPVYDPLRSDVRFQALIRRAGLAP